MAGLLNPYADLNIDLDDTVQNIWETRRKKDKRSEYLLESRLNPYSIWSAAKPQMADATEQSYRELGARNPMLSKDAIATSTPVWSALEMLPGTKLGTMALSAATLPLKSAALKELFQEAKDLGIKTAVPIAKFMTDRLKSKGYKKGINTKSVRQMQDPRKYGNYNYQQANAIEIGYDPVEREMKETILGRMGVKLTNPSNPNYKDNLRMQYRYHTDDEWRFQTLSRNTQKKSTQAAARREMIEKSGTESLPENLQKQMARDRVNSVVQNMRTREVDRGGSFYISDKELAKLKEQLFKIKLKEVRDGTPLIYRMTIDHHYPMIGKTGRAGETIGSGLTSWSNITDSKGKLRLITMLENIQKGETVPSMYQNMILKGGRWRKAPSIMSLK